MFVLKKGTKNVPELMHVTKAEPPIVLLNHVDRVVDDLLHRLRGDEVTNVFQVR